VQLAAEASEPTTRWPTAARIAAQPAAQGLPRGRAARRPDAHLLLRSGRYGTGLDDASAGHRHLEGQGRRRPQAGRASTSRACSSPTAPTKPPGGRAGAGGKAARLNLYAEHLRGTEGAVLSRTSNLYGMLTTDDPFQYLGGIGLAVRHLDGKAPELYISNLRGQRAARSRAPRSSWPRSWPRATSTPATSRA
jgi:cobaltochelatase CobN